MGRFRIVTVMLAVLPALLPTAGCRHRVAPTAPSADVWGPWRQEARPAAEAYQIGTAPARVFPLVTPAAVVSFPTRAVTLPFTADLSAYTLTETEGVELTVRFRLGRTPPARLEASQGLAQFTLKGGGGDRGFALHAYSRGSGLCLNGIKMGSPEQKTMLARGAADPQSSPRWDTQWHTVRIAWCRGQLAASWDGFPILYGADPAIDYRALTLGTVSPGADFGTLELAPFEVRAARFAAPMLTKEP
jgi:hypothetical protein